MFKCASWHLLVCFLRWKTYGAAESRSHELLLDWKANRRGRRLVTVQTKRQRSDCCKTWKAFSDATYVFLIHLTIAWRDGGKTEWISWFDAAAAAVRIGKSLKYHQRAAPHHLGQLHLQTLPLGRSGCQLATAMGTDGGKKEYLSLLVVWRESLGKG